MRNKLRKFPLLILVFILTGVVIFAYISIHLSKQINGFDEKSNNATQVLVQALNIQRGILEVESNTNLYILHPKPDVSSLITLQAGGISKEIEKLKELTRGEPIEQASVDSLSLYTGKIVDISQNLLLIRKEKSIQEVITYREATPINKYRAIVMNYINLLEIAESQELLNYLEEKGKMVAKLNLILFSVFIIVILFVIVNLLQLKKDNDQMKKELENKKYIEKILSTITDAVITTDSQFKIINCNKAAEKLYGFNTETIKGTDLATAVRTQVDKKELVRIRQKMKTTGVWKGEVMHLDAEGREIFIQSCSSAFYDANGYISGYVSTNRDITQQKLADQLLFRFNQELASQVKEKTTELNNIFERITDAFVAFDNDWQYTFINKKAEFYLGKTREQLLGKNVWELFPDDINQPFYNALHEAKRTQRAVQLQLYYAPLDRWFEDYIYPSPDGVSVYYHDITGKKKAEEAFMESEEKYRSLVEQSLTGIYIIQNGRFTYVNPQFAHIFGYEQNEMLTLKKADEIVYEPDKKIVSETILQRLEGKPVKSNYRFRGIKKDGSMIHAEIFVAIATQAGRPVTIGTLLDVTESVVAAAELQNSNKKFQSLIENIPGVYWVNDLETYQTLYISPSYEKIWGRKCGDLYKDSADFINAIHPDDKAIVINGYSTIANSLAAEISYRILRPDGEIRWISAKTSVVIDSNGSKIEYGYAEDITERILAEQEINKSNERFELLASTTHDAIWEWNLETNELWSNETHQLLYGLRMEDPVPTEQMWKQKIHPEERNTIIKLQEATLASDKNVWISEYRFQKPDGNYINIYDRTYIVRNKMGKAVRIMGSMMDITERKKAEEALRESEEKFRTLVQQAADGIFIVDLDGYYLDANESAEIITGYSRAELIKMHASEIVYEEDLKKNPLKLLEIKKDHPVFLERIISRKDNTLVNVEVSAKLMDNGKVISILRDITERKKAEVTLAERENFLRTIIQAEPECVKLLNENGELVDMNAAGLQMIEADSLQQVQGHSVINIISEPYRNDFLNLTKNVFKGKSGKLEFEITGLKGTHRWLETHAVPLKNAEGNIISLLSVTRDTTVRKKAQEELKRSEEKYKLLFRSNPLPVFMLALPELKLLDVNDAAIKHYGYSKEEFLQLPVEDLVHKDDFPFVLKDASQIHSNELHRLGVIRHRKKDGSFIHVEIFAHHIIIEEKLVRLIMAIDITEKLLAEELLKKSYEDIRRLASYLGQVREEERTSIAREIHDELGQLLTVMKMDISWLIKKVSLKDEKAQEKINNLLGLIESTVKTVRRISSELRPSILDDFGLLPAMEWHSQEFEKRSGIKIEFCTEIDELILPDNVTTSLYRIFQESLTNIARHAKASKVNAKLRAEDGMLILTIQDDGIGFDPSVIGIKKTLGILGMRERTSIIGGGYSIKSTPGSGTLTEVNVPLSSQT